MDGDASKLKQIELLGDVGAGILSAGLSPVGSSRKLGRYQERALLTENELEFLYRLSKALPKRLVFAQVFLQALVGAASPIRGLQRRIG